MMYKINVTVNRGNGWCEVCCEGKKICITIRIKLKSNKSSSMQDLQFTQHTMYLKVSGLETWMHSVTSRSSGHLKLSKDRVIRLKVMITIRST